MSATVSSHIKALADTAANAALSESDRRGSFRALKALDQSLSEVDKTYVLEKMSKIVKPGLGDSGTWASSDQEWAKTEARAVTVRLAKRRRTTQAAPRPNGSSSRR